MSVSDSLIVALDLERSDALELASTLHGAAGWMKVGMTLFYKEGPAVVGDIKAAGYDVFLDLKLHDIPHQVEGAARSVASLGIGMLTVHASGGRAMIEAAVRGAKAGAADAGVEPPAILAVTVLTSMSDVELESIGVGDGAAVQVPRLARLAIDAGADGIVCSPLETESVRAAIGPEALIVTPGVRPAWSATGDQQRIATPAKALSAGATHLVIGRPITAADEPERAARLILEEMEGSVQ